MQLALGHVESHDTPAHTLFHDEVDREVFDEERRFVPDRLLVKGMQHRMPGAIGRGAGPLRNALAEMRRHSTERALINASGFCAGERYAVMLELDDSGRSLLAHELDGVLVTQPVRPLYGVIHVPAPVVLTHVAEGGADTTLSGDGMAACWKQLRHARGRKPRLRKSERGAQAGPTGSDD